MVEVRKNYFISLNRRTVSEVSIPDTVEYEVHAKPFEIERFKMLLKANNDKEFSFAAVTMPFKPFAEDEADEMRREIDDNLMEEYQFIYDFGTDETKEKLKEIGFGQ